MAKLDFKSNGSNLYGFGLEDTLDVGEEFDHIEDVEQDVLETIEADVETEDLEDNLNGAIDDLETIEQGDMELDIVEDQNTQYEMVATDSPQVVDDMVVAQATERLTFDLSNHLNLSDEKIKRSVEEKVAREDTFGTEAPADKLAVLTSSVGNVIEEVRSDFQGVISKIFRNALTTPALYKLHADRIRMVNDFMRNGTSGRAIDRNKIYSRIAAAYTLNGNSLNELVTYISNLSTRPIDNVFDAIKSGEDPLTAFSALANRSAGLTVGTSAAAENATEDLGSIDVVTSIIGSMLHYVNIYRNDFGLRYKIEEKPFGDEYLANLDPTPLSAEEIKSVLSNVVYTIRQFDEVQTDAISTLGGIANSMNEGKVDPNVVKATMAVAAKTAKGILHAYTYGLSHVLNACIAETIAAGV